MASKRSEPAEDTSTLTAQYVSIVGMLPPEAQRLVTAHLPHLEAFADAEVDQFGRRLAKALCARVRELADVEKSTGHAELKKICGECPTANETIEAEKCTRDAGAELLRALAEAQAEAGSGSQGNAVATRMGPLREAVRQLRRDIAAGEPEPGIRALGTAFENWCRGSADGGMEADDGEKATLKKARQELVDLIDESGATDDKLTPPPAHGDPATHIEDVASEAAKLHERARKAASGRPGSEDQSSPEFVARRLKELQWLLKQASGADVAEAGDGIRGGVRAAKQAAAHVDRQVRTQPFRVVEAWLRAGGTDAGDGPTFEDARLACARAHAYYDAPRALADTLADVAEGNAVLGRQLEALAGSVRALEEAVAAQRERERRNRALEAGVDRLEHLVEQAAQRMGDRAAAADVEALESRFAVARTKLDALTKATEAMKEKAVAAATVVSAGRRFLREREEASNAICRAVRDITMAAGLTSSGGGDDGSDRSADAASANRRSAE